jgi:CheY-like chemotaxis protein
MEDDVRRSVEAGFVEHLVKPVSVPQLREAIRRVASDGASGDIPLAITS